MPTTRRFAHLSAEEAAAEIAHGETLGCSGAHPDYRDYLNRYLETARPGHFRHDLDRCFELHRNLLEHGRMLP